MDGNGNNSEMYAKGWCKFTGLACVYPHPHRHFTLLEFAYNVVYDKEMYDRFILPLTDNQN